MTNISASLHINLPGTDRWFRLMKKIIHTANILLITVLVYFGIRLFYKVTLSFLSSGAGTMISHRECKRGNDIGPKPLSTYSPIINRNLFNTRHHSLTNGKLPDTKTMPETNLKLKLWGTVVGGPLKDYAVIEDIDTHLQNLYREGDIIKKATVIQILRRAVVLNVDGRDEILEMEDSLAYDPAGLPEPATDDEDMPEGDQRIAIDRLLIDDAVEGHKFMTYAKIRPHFGGPDSSGLKITDIKPDSPMAQMGIREGDIVTSLDGKQFRKTKEVIDYYKSLPPSAGMNLEVVRNGKKITIHYDFQ